MAGQTVTTATEQGKPIFKRAADFLKAVRFAVRGGAYKVHLTFEDDPIIPGGCEITVRGDQKVNTALWRKNTRTITFHQLERAGLMPAEPGDPDAFMVKWTCVDKQRRAFEADAARAF